MRLNQLHLWGECSALLSGELDETLLRVTASLCAKECKWFYEASLQERWGCFQRRAWCTHTALSHSKGGVKCTPVNQAKSFWCSNSAKLPPSLGLDSKLSEVNKRLPLTAVTLPQILNHAPTPFTHPYAFLPKPWNQCACFMAQKSLGADLN